MTAPTDPPDDVSKALALADRNQRVTLVASLAGYVVWIAATLRFMRLADQSGLSAEVTSLLHFGALVLLFGGFATQFMVCNYINMMARRILRAIHLAQTAGARTLTNRPD